MLTMDVKVMIVDSNASEMPLTLEKRLNVYTVHVACAYD